MDSLQSFFAVISKIKHTERRGWKQEMPNELTDTIASHSWGASLLVWILAKEEGLDVEKLMKMLLIHDLIMAFMPDIVPSEKSYKNKKDIERMHNDELFDVVPDSIRDEFVRLFTEFQEGKTKEAKVAKEADKLDTLLQAKVYSEKLGKDILSEFLESYEEKFQSETGRKVFNSLK